MTGIVSGASALVTVVVAALSLHTGYGLVAQVLSEVLVADDAE